MLPRTHPGLVVDSLFFVRPHTDLSVACADAADSADLSTLSQNRYSIIAGFLPVYVCHSSLGCLIVPTALRTGFDGIL